MSKVKEAVLYPFRRAAMWAVMDGPQLPDGWAPWLFGFAIGAKHHQKGGDDE